MDKLEYVSFFMLAGAAVLGVVIRFRKGEMWRGFVDACFCIPLAILVCPMHGWLMLFFTPIAVAMGCYGLYLGLRKNIYWNSDISNSQWARRLTIVGMAGLVAILSIRFFVELAYLASPTGTLS